ncbi:hypothetical protein RRG08_013987 [Elysia crispata]|uniref:Uncharacterized protein n=1 Tax=Elysia crispata TaxID=231223 RepID=A0AAE1CW97_9GAST|nr:hypothetical protein RRG08_013987 [Elysia crispata]
MSPTPPPPCCPPPPRLPSLPPCTFHPRACVQRKDRNPLTRACIHSTARAWLHRQVVDEGIPEPARSHVARAPVPSECRVPCVANFPHRSPTRPATACRQAARHWASRFKCACTESKPRFAALTARALLKLSLAFNAEKFNISFRTGRSFSVGR